MIDGWARRRIDPALDTIAATLASAGVGPNPISVAGLALGLTAAGAIAAGWLWTAVGLILVSRLCDGLDGAVAKRVGPTDLGGYLDIVFDFIFYGAVPLGFALLDPTANALPAAILLLAFYANGASFLAFAIVAAKRGLDTAARGPKSFFFTTGLAEAGETLLVFLAACAFPAWFPLLAYGFAALTAYTTLSLIVLAVRTFG